MNSEQDYSIQATHALPQLMRMLRPHSLKGSRKIRVGRHFDGGYIMLDKFEDVAAAYSLGINDDVSWDLDIAQRGIKLFQYDHTIQGLTHKHDLFNWKKIGIAESDEHCSDDLQTLQRLIKINGHDCQNNLILKCDIEGAEWGMLVNTPNHVISQFSQIVLELHNMHHLSEWGPADAVRKALSNLTASHRLVHVHGNNFAPFGVVGGYPIPASLEITLARHDLGEFIVSGEIFPTDLDMPCNREKADQYLGDFSFGLS